MHAREVAVRLCVLRRQPAWTTARLGWLMSGDGGGGGDGDGDGGGGGGDGDGDGDVCPPSAQAAQSGNADV